ncbi:beta-1,3-galactosyltransferase 1 [Plakobranchus ocellatus]|uniref:Hexosyltransferase n=1 Tax=Plakobranchus ocellatus TaxID=259542 RepID=A0AAV4CFX8_9GAST|nr:beta-1,3-galactosyltransferase 1 [Plakobranchus ocellatus]
MTYAGLTPINLAIVQGNFVDHYFNLTYKTIMGYRWTQLYCDDVKLVLKIDDDVFVDIFRFFDYFLPVINVRQRTIYGRVHFIPRVHRKGKFWIGEHEYSGKNYPHFCSGFFVVVTQDVIQEIYEVAKLVRYFRLEDVFTYAMVRKAMVDVQLTHLDVVTHEWRKYQICVKDYKYRCKYFAAQLSPSDLLEYHKIAMENRRKLGLLGGPNS